MIEDWKSRAEAAEAELARLRTPGAMSDDALAEFMSTPHNARTLLRQRNAAMDRAEKAEAELARLREPAGDVGKVAAKLRGTTEAMANRCSAPLELWDDHSNACLAAADILLRQAGEIDRLHDLDRENTDMMWQRRRADESATYAEALLREASEVMRNMHEVMHRLTAIIPGNDKALTETTDAMAAARDFLAKLKDQSNGNQ